MSAQCKPELTTSCCCSGNLCITEQDLGWRLGLIKAYRAPFCAYLDRRSGRLGWPAPLVSATTLAYLAQAMSCALGSWKCCGSQGSCCRGLLALSAQSSSSSEAAYHKIEKGMSGTKASCRARRTRLVMILCKEAQRCSCHNQQQRAEHDRSVTREPQHIFLCLQSYHPRHCSRRRPYS